MNPHMFRFNHLQFSGPRGRFALRALFFLMAAWGGGEALARDEFTEVTAEELLNFPQKFWSQGVVFRDRLLEHPQGRSIAIGQRTYLPFKTREVGVCYVDRDQISLIEQVPVESDCLFEGTVLHQPAGFFGRSPSFYVVVHRAERMLDPTATPKQILARDARDDRSGTASDELMARVQRELLNYARRNRLQIADLFTGETVRKEAIAHVILSGIARVEQERGITASVILSELVYRLFDAEYGVPSPAAAPPPPPEGREDELELLRDLEQTIDSLEDAGPAVPGTVDPVPPHYDTPVRLFPAIDLKPGIRPPPVSGDL